jgi:hypothetical protein
MKMTPTATLGTMAAILAVPKAELDPEPSSAKSNKMHSLGGPCAVPLMSVLARRRTKYPREGSSPLMDIDMLLVIVVLKVLAEQFGLLPWNLSTGWTSTA